MPRTAKGRIDQLAADRITTDVMIDELRAKIQLAQYEHKATFEKCEAEKKNNFGLLLSERRTNKLRRQGQGGVPDTHNITYAFEKKQPAERIYIARKTMTEAKEIQDNKVCEAIKKYNLKVHEKEEKMDQVSKLKDELEILRKQEQRRKMDWMNSPEMQNIRLLENRIEKLKMKLSSGQLIAKQYGKIIENLKEDTQNYPWKLDELEGELIEHQNSYKAAIVVNGESQNLVEKSIQSTKKFHEEYFESKKNRDKMLANARRDVDKSHREVKGSDKPKAVRGANAQNPMQEIINKEAEDAMLVQQRYEAQRKKRVDYETSASFLKNACKVSSKEEILPAITQQHEVQRALKLQIENLEDQRAVLEIEKKGMSKEYKGLKYFGEKKLSEGMSQIETESDAVQVLKDQIEATVEETIQKVNLIKDVDMSTNNFFMVLQKYKIDPQARLLMTGRLEIDFAILTEKLQQVSDQIEPYGKVSDFLENEKFLDFMEDTLPRANTRVDIKYEEEEGPDVFEDEASKTSSLVTGRDDIKKASQKIIEKNQGKQRRKKTK